MNKSKKRKEYDRLYRATHREQRREYNKKHRRLCQLRNRKYVYEYLALHPCIDCNITDVRVLEFDHKRRNHKMYRIAELMTQGMSLATIQLEIDKCVVRCANCHRIKTLRENKSPRYKWHRENNR